MRGVPRPFRSGPGGFVPGLAGLMGAAVIAIPASGAGRVALYETFELSVTNASSYSNRFDFREIELQAQFTAPSGETTGFFGFHDGDGNGGGEGDVWKVRFMPDETGAWTYTYSWTDGTTGGSGSFEVTARSDPGNHGHVHVDPEHPRYLIHDDGTPHYWWGGKWISPNDYGPVSKGGESNEEYLTDEELTGYLDALEAAEHNGLLVKMALYPLENDKFSWDLGWIHRAEWLVGEMVSRGICVQVGFFDTWSRDRSWWFKYSTDGSRQVFNVWSSGDEDAKRNYIKTIIARFASFSGVYWELGNEMEHAPNCSSCFAEQANQKYIPWIRQYDPYGLPIGLSEGIWQSTGVDIGFLHQSESLPSASWEKPTIMNELVRGGISGSLWSDGAIRNSANRIAYRRTFWRMFTYGGTGSSEATWLDIRDPLNQAVMDVMADHQRLRGFIEALPVSINEMDTDDSFVTSGPGSHRTRRKHGVAYVTYFLLDPGQSAGSGQVRVQLPEGTFETAWYDPKDGSLTSPVVVTTQGGEETLSRPAFHEDIVLRVLREGAGTPPPAPPVNFREID